MSAHNDTAFLRMFLMILGALVAFTVIILIAANQIIGAVEDERGVDPRLRAAIAERIKPIGSVNVAGAADAVPAAPMSGADVVTTSCNSCHGTGVLGAPKVGDKAAWLQRAAAEGGIDGLTASAIKGKNAMPPKGGAMVSDDEIRAAIEHMLTESGVDASAPAPAPGAAPAPAATTPAPAATAITPAPAAAPVAAPAAPVAAAAPTADLAKGKAVYGGACFVCHGTGAAGAPKLGDKALWAPRIAQGIATLENTALRGKGAMPPKGGRMDIPDADVKAAVAYMVSVSQ